MPVVRITKRSTMDPKDGRNIFVDDDEVQHLPTDPVTDTITDQDGITERVKARRTNSKLIL